MGIDRIASIVNETPYMRPSQARHLEDLFSRLRPTRIVELGTYHGAGACYLAELCRPYGGHVITIDLPWTLNRQSHQPKAESLIDQCGLDNVTVIRRDDGAEGWFRDYFASRSPQLDFVYLDSGHTWNCFTSQFAMAYAALRVGGWIVCDDIDNAKYPDVGLAWHNVCKQLASKTRGADNWGFAMRGADRHG